MRYFFFFFFLNVSDMCFFNLSFIVLLLLVCAVQKLLFKSVSLCVVVDSQDEGGRCLCVGVCLRVCRRLCVGVCGRVQIFILY